MDEPPEITEFIRELGGALAQEAGHPPGGLDAPRCARARSAALPERQALPSCADLPPPCPWSRCCRGLPLLAATFACGVTSVVAGALCAVGDAGEGWRRGN